MRRIKQSQVSQAASRSTARPGASSSNVATTSQRCAVGTGNDEFTNLVNNTVYYILVADQHKTPIKRKDIQKFVLKDHSKSIKEVLKEAKHKLSEVFGYQLIDLNDRLGSYILVSQLNLSEARNFLNRNDADNARLGLITLLLALILMNNGAVTEEKLWSLLSLFGLQSEADDPAFGDLRKLITTDLVKQAYLEYTAVTDTEPPTHQFRWGMRAIHEASKLTVLEFVCKVLGNGVRPEQWTAVYNDIIRCQQQEQQ